MLEGGGDAGGGKDGKDKGKDKGIVGAVGGLMSGGGDFGSVFAGFKQIGEGVGGKMLGKGTIGKIAKYGAALLRMGAAIAEAVALRLILSILAHSSARSVSAAGVRSSSGRLCTSRSASAALSEVAAEGPKGANPKAAAWKPFGEFADEVKAVIDANGGAMLATKLPAACLLYTSPSPRDKRQSRMPSSA